MEVEIILLELGDGLETGEVLQILVGKGDMIAEGQSILELETDKAVIEVPTPAAGRVNEIFVAEGQEIPVGGALMMLEVDESTAALVVCQD